MKIGVVMGGLSSERDISLKTGRVISDKLKNAGYDVKDIVINEESDLWNISDIDLVFIGLHGKYGEDGIIQNILDIKGLPYTGCGYYTSSIGMDKNHSKLLAKAVGVPTAKWVTVKSIKKEEMDKIKRLEFPVFVKPNSGGSSVATFKVKTADDLEPAILEALEYDDEVMVEEFARGYEITCPILNREVLPIIKIEATGEFFDLKSKYTDGGAKEEVVKLNPELESKIITYCQKLWDVFECDVYSRVDFIINDNEVNFLEINTLPGMTENSLFPKSAKSYGLTLEELFDKIVKLSLEKKNS